MALPTTFERVYVALKTQLRRGDFHPGDRLEPAILSEQLNASVTPVRDALHRLTGERLVDAPRHEGFRVPMLTETMLRQLYAWHQDLLLLAVARRRWEKLLPIEEDERSDSDVLERQNSIFLELAASTGNIEHQLALRALSERMEPYRRLEKELLDDIEPECKRISTAIRTGDRRGLRKSLLAYHRRRQHIVPDLLARIQVRHE